MNKFKILQITYPNRWHHFVRLCWQSINQLSSIQYRFELTVWMSDASVFQQISLSSTLCVCVFVLLVSLIDDAVFVMRLCWWRDEKKNNRNELQLIHRQNRMMKPLVSRSIYIITIILYELMMNAFDWCWYFFRCCRRRRCCVFIFIGRYVILINSIFLSLFSISMR